MGGWRGIYRGEMIVFAGSLLAFNYWRAHLWESDETLSFEFSRGRNWILWVHGLGIERLGSFLTAVEVSFWSRVAPVSGWFGCHFTLFTNFTSFQEIMCWTMRQIEAASVGITRAEYDEGKLRNVASDSGLSGELSPLEPNGATLLESGFLRSMRIGWTT